VLAACVDGLSHDCSYASAYAAVACCCCNSACFYWYLNQRLLSQLLVLTHTLLLLLLPLLLLPLLLLPLLLLLLLCDRMHQAGAERQCSTCNGSGAQVQYRQIGPGMVQKLQSTCSDCNGEVTVTFVNVVF
jgi:DnaJ central domain